MARKTVANLKDSVSAQLSGLSLNNVRNLNGAFERTARKLAGIIDIPENTIQQALNIYDGVMDYPANASMYGTSFVDLRPQGVTRFGDDSVQKMPGAQFDREKAYIGDSTNITCEYNQGAGVVRIVTPYPTARIELDPMTATTGWTASGSASNLATDASVLWQSPSSLRFKLTGASTGILSKTVTTNDLTAYQGVGLVFLAVRVPTAASLTSITLKLGSSASAYYSVTATAAFLGAFKDNTWQLVAFDLSTATTVGSPTITAMKYVELDFITTATLANVWVGDIWIALPYPATLLYKGTNLFQADTTTTPLPTITNNNDTILLTDEAYVIYEVLCAVEVAMQQGGTLASGLIATLDQSLNGIRGYRGVLVQPGLLDLYRARNPSDRLPTVGNYYEGFRA